MKHFELGEGLLMNETLKAVTVTLNPAIDRTVRIPGFTAGAVNRVESMQSHPGGKGVNVAAVLADLGLSTAATGFLGRENAVVFETLFIHKKIEDRFVKIPGGTRQCIKIEDPVQEQMTEVNFPGLVPSPMDVEFLEVLVPSLQTSWVVLSGSVPGGMEADIYQRLTLALKAKGRKVLLDTSGAPFSQGLLATPSVIKPNAAELAEHVGRPLAGVAEVLAAAREVLAGGVELVIVSMGAEGALYVTEDEVLTAKPPPMEVRSTVGAGDAMVAGTVAGLVQGLALADCARLATACAMDVIRKVGPGLSARAAVEGRLGEIKIAKV